MADSAVMVAVSPDSNSLIVNQRWVLFNLGLLDIYSPSHSRMGITK
jgi:hypothetical protein